MSKQLTCEQRVDDYLKGRLEDLKILWDLDCKGNDEYHPDLGKFNEYGLGFDYVEAETFDDQLEGYFRYQLSYGGPSDEFRVYAKYDYTSHSISIYRVEYWFLDWFDGANREVTNNELMNEIWDYFIDIGLISLAKMES